MEAVQTLEKNSSHVRVSDISDALDLPRPGVTRTVKEMEQKGYLRKLASPDDRRVTYISLRKKAESYPENTMRIILVNCLHTWMTFQKKKQTV